MLPLLATARTLLFDSNDFLMKVGLCTLHHAIEVFIYRLLDFIKKYNLLYLYDIWECECLLIEKNPNKINLFKERPLPTLFPVWWWSFHLCII